MTDTEKLFIKVLESKGWKDFHKSTFGRTWFAKMPGETTRTQLPRLTLDLLHEWEMEYLANCKTVDEKSLWFDLLSIEAGWGDAKTVNDAHFLSELNVATATKEQRLRALARTLGIKEEQ